MNLPKEEIIWYLSYGVLIGGMLQVIAHLIVAKKYKILHFLSIGARSKKKVKLTSFKKHFLPSVFGNSTAHISAFLDTWLASFLAAGSISYLYYANRLFQLPFALFAIATSTVLFPKITKFLNEGEEIKAKEIMKKVFWIVFYALTLAFIVTLVASEEIVKLLFERGAFNEEDTKKTALTLVMYMVGLIPFGLNKLFSSFLYATHKHLKAAKFAAISLIINIFFSIILIIPMKVYGLALASSIGGMVLFLLTLKEYGFREFSKFFEKKYILGMIFVIFISIILAFVFKETINFIKE